MPQFDHAFDWVRRLVEGGPLPTAVLGVATAEGIVALDAFAEAMHRPGDAVELQQARLATGPQIADEQDVAIRDRYQRARARRAPPVVERDGVKLFLPAESRLLLDGVTIDFADTPTQTGLVFHDPKQVSCRHH